MQRSLAHTTSLLVEEARLRAHLGTPTKQNLVFAELGDSNRRAFQPNMVTRIVADETIQRCAASE